MFDHDRPANLVVEAGTRPTVRLLETLGQPLLERVLAGMAALERPSP